MEFNEWKKKLSKFYGYYNIIEKHILEISMNDNETQ